MLIGLGKATELLLMAPILTAKQALEIGLLNQVVGNANLPRVTQEIAEKLARGPVHREMTGEGKALIGI